MFLIICEDVGFLELGTYMGLGHGSAVCVANEQNTGEWPWRAGPWRGEEWTVWILSLWFLAQMTETLDWPAVDFVWRIDYYTDPCLLYEYMSRLNSHAIRERSCCSCTAICRSIFTLEFLYKPPPPPYLRHWNCALLNSYKADPSCKVSVRVTWTGIYYPLGIMLFDFK